MFLIVYAVYGSEPDNDLDSDQVEFHFLKHPDINRPEWTTNKEEAIHFSDMDNASLVNRHIIKKWRCSLPSMPVVVCIQEEECEVEQITLPGDNYHTYRRVRHG